MSDCTGAFLRSARLHAAVGQPTDTVFVVVDEFSNRRSDVLQADSDVQGEARHAFALVHNGTFEYNGFNQEPVTFPETNVTRLHIRLYQEDGVTPLTLDPARKSVLNIYLG